MVTRVALGCQTAGSIPALTTNKIKKYMEKLKDWEIVDWICATVVALWCGSIITVVIMELIG